MNKRFISIKNTYIKSDLVRGFIATLLGSGASRILLVMTTFIVARMLSEDSFGQFSFVRSTLDLILSICAVNFSSLTTKFTSEINYKSTALHHLFLVIFFSLGLSILMGLMLLFLPEYILLKFFVDQDIARVFRVIGCILPFIFLAPLIQGIFRGRQQFKLIGIIQTICAAIFLICAILLSYLYGVNGALWAVLLYYLSSTLVSLIPFIKRLDLKQFQSRIIGWSKERMVVIKVILPMFILSFVEAPAFWVAQLILTHSGGYKSIAAMAIIMQIRSIILIIPGYFYGTYLSFASKMNAEGNYTAYFKKFDMLTVRILFISLITVLILIIFGRLILEVFGHNYVDYYDAYLWGILALPFFLVGYLLRVHFVIREKQRTLLLISISWNLIWLILFGISIKLTSIYPLSSFFITQFIAVIVFTSSLFAIYQRDKKRKSYEKR